MTSPVPIIRDSSTASSAEAPPSPQEEWSGPLNPLSDPSERRVLFAALSSFHQYRPHTHLHTTHARRQAFYALPPAHITLLSSPPISLLSTLDAIDAAISSNASIAEAILACSLAAFSLPLSPPSPQTTTNISPLDWRHPPPNPHDISKASTTIRQLYRDWSLAGAHERTAHYDPILRHLSTRFPGPPSSRNGIRVLIPGCGLARLVYEFVLLGFDATGTEISYHALLASSYILNHCASKNAHVLYPFVTGFSNHLTRADQLRGVDVPDVWPGEELKTRWDGEGTHPFERMAVEAGDFVDIYGGAGGSHDKDQMGGGRQYDVLATSFFIDTAPNILRYMEAAWRCLKEGGVWVNVGPLLWHWDPGDKRGDDEGEDDEAPPSHAPNVTDENNGENVGTGKKSSRGIQEPGSVELTWDEVLLLLPRMGFVLEKAEIIEEGGEGYIANERSMFQNRYRVGHWVAIKTGGAVSN